MFTKEDIQKSITNITDKPSKKKPDVIRFNIKGSSDKSKKKKFTDDESVAIILDIGSPNKVYKLRVDRQNHLFNPLNNSLKEKNSFVKDEKYKFRVVNKVAFENYLQFLITKYDSLLIKAERNI